VARVGRMEMSWVMLRFSMTCEIQSAENIERKSK
jgi:hypothetical protein